MKRYLSLAIILLTIVSMFTGCFGDAYVSQETTDAESTYFAFLETPAEDEITNTVENEPTDETTNIVESESADEATYNYIEEPTFAPTEVTVPETEAVYEQDVEEESVVMVWIPRSGKKYHSSSSCSNMKGPSYVSMSAAIGMGYTACKKCYG